MIKRLVTRRIYKANRLPYPLKHLFSNIDSLQLHTYQNDVCHHCCWWRRGRLRSGVAPSYWRERERIIYLDIRVTNPKFHSFLPSCPPSQQAFLCWFSIYTLRLSGRDSCWDKGVCCSPVCGLSHQVDQLTRCQ